MGALSVVAGRYQLEGLAQPSDASTFVGTDLTTNATVLVCLVTADGGGAARTRRTIEHPALLPVREVIHGLDQAKPSLKVSHGRASGFVVLDLPESETLEGRVARKGKLELPPAVRTVVALTNALAAIHAEGAIHGSVVPGAIELRELEDGGPRLGLAGVSDLSLAYESPPRLCGEGASEGDDVWALLGCLYFAVTGVAPFSAESPAALARRILGGRPMPITTTSPAAAALQKIFDRGFSRTAALRYDSAEALREDLRAWLTRNGSHNDTPMVSVAPPPNPATTTARRRDSGAIVNPATTTAKRKEGIDAALMKKAVPSDRPVWNAADPAPMRLANRPLDHKSEPPPPTKRKDPPSDRPTEGAIPASRRSERDAMLVDQLASNYPKLGGPTSKRSQTARWGSREIEAVGSPAPTPPPVAVTPAVATPLLPSSPPAASRSEPAPPVAVREVDPYRPQTAWPSAALVEEAPVTPRSNELIIPPEAVPASRSTGGIATPSEPTLTAIPRPRELDAPVAEETVRISRDQLTELESESRRRPASQAGIAVALQDEAADAAPADQREAKTDPPAARASERPPATAPRAVATPSPVRQGSALTAFLAGIAVAGAIGGAFVLLREKPAASKPAPAPSARVSVDAADTRPAASAPIAAQAPAAVSSTPAQSAAPKTPENLYSCVAKWFPEETFESSADFGWVCDGTDGRRALRDMQRAVVAGGRGLRVTDGMKDWARYRWFQYPVLVTLKQDCCPNPAKLETPRGSPACPSASEAITQLGTTAAKRDGDLEPPIRQLRRMASCMAETGDASFFALEGPMSGGEETLFRAFVERGRR